jgi:signal peptidase II
MMNRYRAFILPIVVVGLVLLFDQWLKYWVHTHIYESHKVIFPNWFMLYYTENNGMAFGVEIGGIAGKIILTVFRIVAVFAIIWYLAKQIRLEANKGFIVCIALILAGAVGNIIDSVFYGVIYRSQHLPWFQGRVIDMLYFPVIDTYLPKWLPIWGGERFQFFRPVFNIADASISIGIIAILVFQKFFFRHESKQDETNEGTISTTAEPLHEEVDNNSMEQGPDTVINPE